MLKVVSGLLVLCFVGGVVGLACSRQDQCLSVTTNYNYAQCDNGQCVCRKGFVGNATTSNPCGCPYGVYWGNSTPYCIKCDAPRSIQYDTSGNPVCVSLSECNTLTLAADTNAIRKSVIRNLYQHLIYPNPLPVIASLQIDGIFASNVSGRVTPIGQFDDFDGCVEYFFVLAANPYKYVFNASIPIMLAEGDLIFVRVDLVFNDTTSGSTLGARSTVTQEGYFRFNADNLIVSFDLVNVRQGLEANLPAALQPYQIDSTCAAIQGYCTNYPQYPSHAACVNYLSNNVTFGSWDNAPSNSVVCRILHSLLIAVRPQVHCAHTGPSGGGKCVDHTYEDWYNYFY